MSWVLGCSRVDWEFCGLGLKKSVMDFPGGAMTAYAASIWTSWQMVVLVVVIDCDYCGCQGEAGTAGSTHSTQTDAAGTRSAPTR